MTSPAGGGPARSGCGRRSRGTAGPLTGGFTIEEWSRVRDGYPIGTVVTATVTSVLPDNCSYWIRFGPGAAAVTSAAGLPPVGTTGRYVVVGVLETTRRLVLVPADGGA